MFDDLYKAANREIPVDSALKAATVQKMLAHQSPKKTRHAVRYSFATAALALVLAVVYLFTNSGFINSVQAIAAPTYPNYKDNNMYNKQFEENKSIDATFIANISDFSYHSASVILANQNQKANGIYSPASLYMAMAMLAESSKGQTQAQILNVLSMNSMDLVSSQTGKLFRSLYYDNEFGKLSIANSMWLNKNITFKKTFLQKLATDCYAHSFSSDFSDNNTAKQIGKWVQQYTGGKLGGNAQDFQTNQNMVMMLLNTLYFYDQWTDKFDVSNTKKDIFHLSDGSTVSSDFMNTAFDQDFMRESGFTSSSLQFRNGCKMVFVLPDKGVSPYDLLADTTKLSKAIDPIQSEEKFGKVTFKIPKFKFSTKTDLVDSLKTLGMKDAFEPKLADFSEVSDIKPLYVSSVKQEACISIDENGCEAAAYTKVETLCGAAAPQNPAGKADMILDRPFIFAILGTNNVPLFIGVVNNPNA